MWPAATRERRTRAASARHFGRYRLRMKKDASAGALREPVVAYLGPPGTFTHAAARQAFSADAALLPVEGIPGVFAALAAGTASEGVVPVENSTEGGVGVTLDGLLETAARISGEVVLPIEHCLLSSASSLGEVTAVHSHPQALAQCRRWLATHLPRAATVAAVSTGAAALTVRGDPRAAALAPRLCAELYGLGLLAESLQDQSDNRTRFLVLSAADHEPTGHDRTSLAFSTRHECGALRRALETLDRHGANLTRIESRPSGQLWEYVFFVDVEGHRSSAPLSAALDELAGSCVSLKVLGSYPRA